MTDSESISASASSQELDRPSPKRSTLRRLLLSAGLALTVVGLWYWLVPPSPASAKAALLTALSKSDGKLADKVEFWVGLREAGYISFLELDHHLDYDGGPFRPTFDLSPRTIAAYHKWRLAKSQDHSPSRVESAAEAKTRLLKAMQRWEPNQPRLKALIDRVENGEDPEQLFAVELFPVARSAESLAAFKAWGVAWKREQK